MVCIAAFIILLLVGIIVAFISIFKRDIGRKYLKLLKKSFHCFSKRVRLQKCDTNFSDDVKNLLLRKVVIKRPKWVKPISIGIEVASVLIVIITAWSLIEATKAGLSLWVFGTCNVSQPSNCALGADSCSIDAEDPKNPVEYVGRWFSEWGEIFSNIPDRVRRWNVADYINDSDDSLSAAYFSGNVDGSPALAIIDPGCSVCLQSYKNIHQNQAFLGTHYLAVVIYPVENTDGSLRFANSELITRYILATNYYQLEHDVDQPYALSEKIMARIFTEYDADGTNYQAVFNNNLDESAAASVLESWLAEWGLDESAINSIRELTTSDIISQQYNKNRELIDQKIHPKGIPTFIYNGKKHLGLFKP